MRNVRLKSYKNNLLSNNKVRNVILDQYGRVFKYDSKTRTHIPTGLCGHANH